MQIANKRMISSLEKKQKSKVDILIEEIHNAFIENGLEPPKLTSKTGNLIILYPMNTKKD